VTQDAFQWAEQPPKIDHSSWGCAGPHLNYTWFLGPTRVYPPIGISIDSAVRARGRDQQTDTQTTQATLLRL